MPNPWNLKWQLVGGKDLKYKSHKWLTMTCGFFSQWRFHNSMKFLCFLTPLQIAWFRSISHKILSKSHEPNDKKNEKIWVQKYSLTPQTGKALDVALLSCSWWETSLQAKASHDSPPKGTVPDHETCIYIYIHYIHYLEISQDCLFMILLWSQEVTQPFHLISYFSKKLEENRLMQLLTLRNKHSFFFGANHNPLGSVLAETETVVIPQPAKLNLIPFVCPKESLFW